MYSHAWFMWFAHDHYSRCEMKIPVSCSFFLDPSLLFFLSFAISLFIFLCLIDSDRVVNEPISTQLRSAMRIRMTGWLNLNEWRREGCYDIWLSMVILSYEPLISLLLFSVSALLSCPLSLSSSLWSSSLIELLMLRIARLDASFPLLIDYIIRQKQNDRPNVCSVHRIDWIAVFIDRWLSYSVLRR